ncbi:hypothetical protein TNCV_4783711 [Trichonephila clavipes]|nr:hypothetical protein TNCV_4783711 [Trichonephila clavipes]
MVLLPEEVGEKGFLESRFPTFRIDSSRKGHARGPVLRVATGVRRQKGALDEQRCPVNKKFLQEERRFVTILVLKETPPWQQRTPEIGKKKT